MHPIPGRLAVLDDAGGTTANGTSPISSSGSPQDSLVYRFGALQLV